jgi:hypothetical protein
MQIADGEYDETEEEGDATAQPPVCWELAADEGDVVAVHTNLSRAEAPPREERAVVVDGIVSGWRLYACDRRAITGLMTGRAKERRRSLLWVQFVPAAAAACD